MKRNKKKNTLLSKSVKKMPSQQTFEEARKETEELHERLRKADREDSFFFAFQLSKSMQ